MRFLREGASSLIRASFTFVGYGGVLVGKGFDLNIPKLSGLGIWQRGLRNRKIQEIRAKNGYCQLK